jgi:hypothetical protein
MHHSAARRLSLVKEHSVTYGESPFPSKAKNSIPTRSLQIHEKAVATSKTYLRSQSDLIDCLHELDQDKTYLIFEVTSLYAYCLKFLNLSEDAACDLIAIMRKAKSVPELKTAIRNGDLTVSKARRLVPVIDSKNQAAWIDLASKSSSRIIERAVAAERPELATTESLCYKSAERLELVLGVSEEWSQLLNKLKDLTSQKRRAPVSTEVALQMAMKEYIERFDPLEKSQRFTSKSKKSTASKREPKNVEARQKANLTKNQTAFPKPQSSNDNPNISSGTCRNQYSDRAHLPAAIRHGVVLRDRNQCTYESESGRRCESKRWLDIHHIVQVAQGGSNDIANLRTLCSAHHRMIHKKRH